ncbi:hypothetical protein [Desulfosarcina widdelii]|uniref:hypothetical protein n=1 Tax=Desulfosarcina widdelii TaxID=947919 RepID=UPI0012D2AC16|nr:hypothetical protein [Desulfosarcina widdelii]
MVRYWKSKKLEVVVEKRRAELDLLIDFANVDIAMEASRHLQTRVLEQLRWHPALNPVSRDLKVDDQSALIIIGALQEHLRLRLDVIIENKQMLWEMPLWQISGSLTFTLDPLDRRFQERFQLRKVKRGNEINALKKVMDLWLVEIIRDLDFSPRRFGQCPRCDGFFYSPTAKERVYCSTRCGGATRQEKFREERRRQDDS